LRRAEHCNLRAVLAVAGGDSIALPAAVYRWIVLEVGSRLKHTMICWEPTEGDLGGAGLKTASFQNSYPIPDLFHS